MIKVTLEFANQAELLAYFADQGAKPLNIMTDKLPVKDVKDVANMALKKIAEPPAPKPAPAAAPTAQAPTPAAAASSTAAAAPTVDYPTLQKAVFALANASRDAAGAVATKFGVKTFKELAQDQWAPALTAVNEALESLKVAA